MLKVFNTLSDKKEEFVPIEKNKVNMYSCGITVYDKPHIGHIRKEVVTDLIVRYLQYSGYDVNYVRNFTDVDDKIINRSNEEKIPMKELAEKNIRAFHEAVDSLDLKRPDVEPKATEHIGDIISIIEKLIEKGHAYESSGNVYFSVKSFKGYGKLSHRNVDDMIAGTRFQPEGDKKFPLDFALWKKSTKDEPSWESPWGSGRPGWHIECSAMSTKYLGDTFDIHGGGKDLVFPHHENEIAQSEGASGKKFVKYWIHNGFLTVEGEKMSKSLGNFITVEKALEKYHPEVLRYFMLSTHYRTPIDFSMDNLLETERRLNYFYETMSALYKLTSGTDNPPEKTERAEKFINNFKSSMDDDFNSAKVVATFFELFRYLNDILPKKKTRPTPGEALGYIEVIKEAGDVLGVLKSEPEKIMEKIKEYQLNRNNIERKEIEDMIKERNLCRKNKDYNKADSIRDRLLTMGISIKDTPEGTKWMFS